MGKDIAPPPVAGGKGQATDSMVACMTKGELKDFACPHNARIEAALKAAQQELQESKTKSVWDDYEADTELIGRGAFARVFRALKRDDGSPVAIKVIGRETKAFPQQRRAMATKIATMRTLKPHPNMLQLHDVFEDEEGFHVVLEYCKGAALLEQIHNRGHFSERDAAHVMRQLLEFLAFSHDDCNIVHRDIKPENLLLLDQDAPQSLERVARLRAAGGNPEGVEAMCLKVIDFGTAGFCEPGQHLHSKVGTARYVAPEVLNQDYDRLSDIWSAGVVMYILLCGHPPFKGSTETGTLKKVKAGDYKLDDDVWAEVHDSAKDMISHMMVVDPAQRWSARELLNHKWFQEVLTAPDRVLTQQLGYMQRLGAFTGAARVKRLALKLMVAAAVTTPGVLQSSELQKLRAVFEEMDLDHDGVITGQQLHEALAKMGATISERDVAEFLKVSKVDSHADGINFNEFIAAMFDSQKLAKAEVEKLLEREFEELDVDHDGFITAEDLVAASRSAPSNSNNAAAAGTGSGAEGDETMSAALHKVVHEVLGDDLTLAEAKQMLAEVDARNAGKLSLSEFTVMVMGHRKGEAVSSPRGVASPASAAAALSNKAAEPAANGRSQDDTAMVN